MPMGIAQVMDTIPPTGTVTTDHVWQTLIARGQVDGIQQTAIYNRLRNLTDLGFLVKNGNGSRYNPFNWERAQQ